MNKGFKLLFGGFLILVLFLTYLEATQPEPVNWNPSYLETDKIALGTFVLFDAWTNTSDVTIEKVRVPPYEFLEKEEKGTYIFLNDHVVFDNSELKKILNWVSKGNTLFVSAGYIGNNLLDTLNLETTTFSEINNFISRPGLNFVHPELKNEKDYKFSYDIESLYFNEIDTINNVVLGTTGYGENPSEDRKVNFLKAGFGKGQILLHTNPQALANFFLLTENNYEYAEGVLAYLDSGENVFWDNYYKSGKAYNSSPLYILLGNKELKWAYYFVLLGSIIFIIFEGKRKQRAIPVIEPLKNQTYEYSKTIADLYLEQKKFKSLAEKSITHFYDYIRTKFRIDTTSESENFYSELAEKSNNSIADTKALFETFRKFSGRTEITKEELQDLNAAIQSYKTK